MKVGIIGGRGFLGRALFNRGIELGFSAQLILNSREINEFDLVINANGNSKKYLAQNDPFQDYQKNVSSTAEYISIFQNRVNKYVHISSGEIYGAMSTTPVEENFDSLTGLIQMSNYGFSKRTAEILVERYMPTSLILRLGGQIGLDQTKGPLFDLLGDSPLRISSSSTLQLMRTKKTAEIIYDLGLKDGLCGSINLTSSDPLPVWKIAELCGIHANFESNATTYVSNLSTKKLSSLTPIPTCEEEVRSLLEEIEGCSLG